ncbi:MAG TPA: SCO family protein [Solirubrobacteraceae bacterium]|nr:SCO family protein [Solirubrobacteraceae bacterium]
MGVPPPPSTGTSGPGSDPTPPSEPTADANSRSGLSPTILLALLVLVVIAGAVALLSGGGGKTRPSAPGVQGVFSAKYSGSLASPAESEPPLSLRNYRGQRVNIRQYHGKAVLLTFLYTKCPDVCPIIASNLGVALNLMGSAKASKVQVVAVSVDPHGDTPAAVATFLARHGVAGRMQYLIGSAAELGKVWKAWGVGSERDAQQPQLVNHTGLVYGISAAGKVTTLYAANFTPQEIVHDTPLLAAG